MIMAGAQMAEGLTFTIQPDAESASLSLFRKSIEDIERLIRDVDYVITRDKSPRRWIISGLHASAPTVNIRPILGDTESVDAIARGIAIVTAGAIEPPRYFTEAALDDLRRMNRLFSGRDRARAIIVSLNATETATIREDIREKADKILAETYQNLGSIEGDLEAINLHGASTFTVWDRVSLAPVRCYFPKDHKWINRVKELLEKRVLVQGTIHYFRNGVPRAITKIEAIHDYTPDVSLPKAEFGSIPDRDAAHDPVAFLRLVRVG